MYEAPEPSPDGGLHGLYGQLRNWPPAWVSRTGLFPACRTGAVAHGQEL
ncbi:unnamed protein product [Ciceribacter selenitireducens ATCC BAA-1503]|uniref:Uncharacterized protein n=1 Tax=Ciceribacter selenitireducens ATCC BAA-1503 TaxID=1336235 RepID=A0A376AHX6_9HYPH|nr:unnamed protein product [Ciceribacter selenitireducens ATCC BAA-1503]